MKKVNLIEYWTDHFELPENATVKGRLKEIRKTIVKAMKSGQTSCVVMRVFRWKHYVQRIDMTQDSLSPLSSPRAIDTLSKTPLTNHQDNQWQLKPILQPFVNMIKEEGLQWRIALPHNYHLGMELWAELVVYWPPTLETRPQYQNLYYQWLYQLAVKTIDDSRIVEWRKICLRAMQAGQHQSLLMVLWTSDFTIESHQPVYLSWINVWNPIDIFHQNTCQLDKRFVRVEEWARQEGVQLYLTSSSPHTEWVYLMATWVAPAREPDVLKDVFLTLTRE